MLPSSNVLWETLARLGSRLRHDGARAIDHDRPPPSQFPSPICVRKADQREARGRLRRTLHRLRDELGADVLAVSSDTIHLHHAADLWLDCMDFLNHAASGLEINGRENLSLEHVEHLRAAAARYTDDFLVGWTVAESAAFDEWQFFERERLRQTLAQVLEALVERYGAQGEWQGALPYARRWVMLDPLHEPAQRHLMTAYAWAGQQAAAVRQYQECARVLDAELGVAPDEATTALYDAIRFRRFPPPADDAPARSKQEATPLPTQRVYEASSPSHAPSSTSGDGSTQAAASTDTIWAVGRETELRQLREHLERALGGTRQIVFVAGELGIGKTTLVDLLFDTTPYTVSLWIGRGAVRVEPSRHSAGTVRSGDTRTAGAAAPPDRAAARGGLREGRPNDGSRIGNPFRARARSSARRALP